MTSIFSIFSTIVLTLDLATTARILCIFPVPFDSHQIVFQRITEELSRDGHELVVLTPLPHKNPVANVTEIDVHNISYKMWEELAGDALKNRKSVKMEAKSFFKYIVYDSMYQILDAQLSVPEMQNIIQDESQTFDLILVEACIRPGVIVSARFKAPVIMISTFFGFTYDYYAVGAAVDPIVFPTFYVKKSWNLPIWEKLSSVYHFAVLRLLDWEMEKVENSMIRKHFGDDAPTMAELMKNVQMLLLNVHHSWDFNRPVPPNVLYLGALHLKDPKPLRSDLKTYLDNSANGVIYMSLGSKLKSSDLPADTVHLIVRVFASLPYNVIWKWEEGNITDKPKNLRLEKWLPQNDMLHHPNIKVFITHAGLQSTDESIAARVPLVGLPVFCDQFANADKYKQYGIGVALDIDNLNEVEFRKAIIEVAQKQSYTDNINQLALVMEEERFGALEKALRWVKHFASHGAPQLRPPLPDLSFAEYYMLDVIAAVLLIVVILISSVIVLLKYVISKLVREISFRSKLKLS